MLPEHTQSHSHFGVHFSILWCLLDGWKYKLGTFYSHRIYNRHPVLYCCVSQTIYLCSWKKNINMKISVILSLAFNSNTQQLVVSVQMVSNEYNRDYTWDKPDLLHLCTLLADIQTVISRLQRGLVLQCLRSISYTSWLCTLFNQPDSYIQIHFY